MGGKNAGQIETCSCVLYRFIRVSDQNESTMIAADVGDGDKGNVWTPISKARR